MTAPLRVILLVDDTDDPEAAAAGAWLREVGLLADARRLEEPGPVGPDHCDVVWVHAAAPIIEPDPAFEALTEPLECGSAVLTGGAAALPFTLGIEPEPPNDAGRFIWRDEEDDLYLFDSFAEFPRIRGHAAFRAHPLFDGLGSGVYTWAPRGGEAHTAVTYRAPAWPLRGRVIAVERSFIHMNRDRATIWEYDPMEARADEAERRVLCIGAYLAFHARDRLFHHHVRRLAWNAIQYAAGRRPSQSAPGATPRSGNAHAADDTAARYWQRWTATTKEAPALELPDTPALNGPLPAFGCDVSMSGAAGDDAPLTLAGRRAFVAGGEARGIDEVWVHPLRIATAPRVRHARAGTATVTPAGLERELDVAGSAVVERAFVAHELPVVLMEWTAADSVILELDWTTDLRLMWPYPAGALGPLRWRCGDRSLLVACAADTDTAWFGFDAVPDALEVEDATAGEASALSVAARFALRPGASLRMAMVGATDAADLGRTLRRLRDPSTLVTSRLGASARRAAETLSIDAPEPEAARALTWAKERLASYLVETPGVGRSLVAGYWGASKGWFGDGRPGYAWYFGRDAVWTALASLAVGDFDAARDVLRFLGSHQDLSGKILHECTTSGSVHYDAADATPLYLLLAARIFAWTGDTAALRAEWERIMAAYRFCLDTDRDGDGLIENTGVGHGWIEFGRLGGGTVTYYNAGIWAAALRELKPVAEALGEDALAAELEARHDLARAALESTFLDPGSGGYAINVRRTEAGWERNTARTVMQAVPLLLGVADVDQAAAWLDAVASEDFTAPWGVRMLPQSDPAYNPESYHGGAIWPLYTGWAAWAEYAAGRSEAGFRHWWMNVEQAWWRERGAWDEVLHGTERRGRGVCPDQAWSTAMAVAPLVYGLLGVEPDAAVHRIRIRPRIPEAWDRFDVRGLRVGDAAVSMSYRREGGRHRYRLRQDRGGMPLTLVFEPVVAANTVRAAVDGVPATLDARRHGDDLLVPVQIALDAERVLVLETT